MISGVVIHLSTKESQANETLATLQARKGIECGDRVGSSVPAVVESTECYSAEETTAWLMDLPGVAHVDITFVDLEG